MVPSRLAWLGRGIARDLADRFEAAGYQLYLVGGSVRDALLDRASPDLDFATDALPDRTKSLLSTWADQIYTMGERFGTIGILKDGKICEITTFRAESYREDSRHPRVTFGASIEEDLERRDFTINAMGLCLGSASPSFIDPFNGAVDLARGILRTPAGPALSFSDDPLRMLRLFRFMAQLGFTAEPAELEAVSRMKGRLGTISRERVRDELSKLVVAEHASLALRTMISSGLAQEFIPEVPSLAMTADPQHRHKDVLAHSLAVMQKASPDLVLRLAALFHDVGKPETRRFHGSKVTFHHHEVVGARLTRRRLRELRYPKQVVADVSELVFLHMRAHTFKMGWTDSAVRRYVRDAGHLLDRLNELARCDVTTRNDRRARRIQRQIDELEERIVDLRTREELDAIRPPIDGFAVMTYLGIGPGPLVGEALGVLLEKRIEEGPYDEEEAFELVRAWAASQGLPDPGDPPSGG